jgi:hypothetical protein
VQSSRRSRAPESRIFMSMSMECSAVQERSCVTVDRGKLLGHVKSVGPPARPQSYLAVAVNTFSVVYIPLCSYIYMEQ